jgi:hypothetical protein
VVPVASASELGDATGTTHKASGVIPGIGHASQLSMWRDRVSLAEAMKCFSL